MAIDEQYAGTPVRDLFIRYPLRVVRADVDPQRNPWGLQVDCFDGIPQRLSVPDAEKQGAPNEACDAGLFGHRSIRR